MIEVCETEMAHKEYTVFIAIEDLWLMYCRDLKPVEGNTSPQKI